MYCNWLGETLMNSGYKVGKHDGVSMQMETHAWSRHPKINKVSDVQSMQILTQHWTF